MADPSLQSDPADAQDEDLTPDTEIAVRLDSLEADGVRPRVGDDVTVKVDGTVKKIENDYAYINATAINDTDINEIVSDTQQSEDDEDSMMARITAQADQANMSGGYG
jgi:hypothetical protein